MVRVQCPAHRLDCCAALWLWDWYFDITARGRARLSEVVHWKKSDTSASSGIRLPNTFWIKSNRRYSRMSEPRGAERTRTACFGHREGDLIICKRTRPVLTREAFCAKGCHSSRTPRSLFQRTCPELPSRIKLPAHAAWNSASRLRPFPFFADHDELAIQFPSVTRRDGHRALCSNKPARNSRMFSTRAYARGSISSATEIFPRH